MCPCLPEIGIPWTIKLKLLAAMLSSTIGSFCWQLDTSSLSHTYIPLPVAVESLCYYLKLNKLDPLSWLLVCLCLNLAGMHLYEGNFHTFPSLSSYFCVIQIVQLSQLPQVSKTFPPSCRAVQSSLASTCHSGCVCLCMLTFAPCLNKYGMRGCTMMGEEKVKTAVRGCCWPRSDLIVLPVSLHCGCVHWSWSYWPRNCRQIGNVDGAIQTCSWAWLDWPTVSDYPCLNIT